MPVRQCAHCHRPLAQHRRRSALYCDDRPCKLRAWRRRQAGLAEDAYSDGGRRGRVALGELTLRERAALLFSELPRITGDTAPNDSLLTLLRGARLRAEKEA